MTFSGLSAFPLTPVDESEVDERAFVGLVRRLAEARVGSIGALGSTGSYAYLSREQRARVAQLAVEAADGVPVSIGIGALRTADVLRCAEDAQRAGATSVLLAPMTYQPLTDDEIVGLYADVTAELSVPLWVYDNPTTTGVTLTEDLYARITALPGVTAVKIPPVAIDPAVARDRIAALDRVVPAEIALGISGDPCAAVAMGAGAVGWFSGFGGLFPDVALEITRAALAGDDIGACAASDRLEPLWELARAHGTLRVVAAAAQHLGLVGDPVLPRPVRGLDDTARRAVIDVITRLGLR